MTTINNLPVVEKDFFILLRAGLWQKVEGTLSATPDWQFIYHLACDHTVAGIVADGITLYQSMHPEFEIAKEWQNRFFSLSVQIIRSNDSINALQARICKRLHEAGIRYVVMKGQAVARFYPKPMLRNAGDIDIFFDYKDYERAKKLLHPLADRGTAESSVERSIGFIFDGIIVELHADEAYSYGRQRLFHSLFTETLNDGKLRDYECNGVKVKTVPATFDVFYSFLHCNAHLMNMAVGLRQFCDLAVLMHCCCDELDFVFLDKYVNLFRSGKKWRQFMSFLHFGLALPVDKTGFAESNLDRSDFGKIWHICRKSGNFGCRNAKIMDSHSYNWVLKNIILFHFNHKKAWSTIGLDLGITMRRVLNIYRMYIVSALRKTLHIGGEKFNMRIQHPY